MKQNNSYAIVNKERLIEHLNRAIEILEQRNIKWKRDFLDNYKKSHKKYFFFGEFKSDQEALEHMGWSDHWKYEGPISKICRLKDLREAAMMADKEVAVSVEDVIRLTSVLPLTDL